MKAHGVPALIRHLKGEITLDEAAEIGRADTRHYAKRQFTWFRHQLPEFEWVTPEEARGWLETARSRSVIRSDAGRQLLGARAVRPPDARRPRRNRCAWLNRKFALAERPEPRYTAEIALIAAFP